MTTDLITDILEIARQAPSGDNLQTWQFSKDSETTLTLYFADSPVTEPEYFATGVYCSLGMMIEYVSLAALACGHTAVVTHNMNFSPHDDRVVATFSFVPETDQTKIDAAKPLIAAIPHRRTVRARYANTPIPPSLLANLSDDNIASAATVTWLTTPAERTNIASVLTACNSYFWATTETRTALVHSLFDNKKNTTQRFGMPTTTLGAGLITPIILTFFALAQKLTVLWKIVSLQTALETTQQLTHSGAIGVIHITTTKPSDSATSDWFGHDHILGGQLAARIWLRATSQGLLLQPLYHFVAVTAHKNNDSLGSYFAKCKTSALSALERLTRLPKGKELVFAFRIGYPTTDTLPTTKTPRRNTEEILIGKSHT